MCAFDQKCFTQVAQVKISTDGSIFKGLKGELVNSIKIILAIASSVNSASASSFVNSTIHAFA